MTYKIQTDVKKLAGTKEVKLSLGQNHYKLLFEKRVGKDLF
jgi:hypothetical protein